MRAREIPKALHQALVKRWVLSALVPVLPGLYGLVVRYKGVDWALVSPQGSLTAIGDWTLWCLLILAVVVAIGKAAGDRYDRKVNENDSVVLRCLLDAVNAVTRNKLSRFEAFIGNHRTYRGSAHPLNELAQPEQQIERILENVQTALSEIHDIRRDAIGLSLVCKERGQWRWLAKVNLDNNDLDIETLCSDNQTTFSHVLSKQKGSAFYPDKRSAKKQDAYVYSKRDTAHKEIGSIVVRDLSVGEGDDRLPAVLSIGTYGRQLCAEDDEGAEKAITGVLLPCFESRLKLELCLYFMKTHTAHNAISSAPPAISSSPSAIQSGLIETILAKQSAPSKV